MVTIKFKTDNAAFRADDNLLNLYTIADAVMETAKKIKNGYLAGDVMDYNGNTVGTFKVTNR